ncbi:MAG: type II toxin-antitoxin system Xre/ParS family antitoxin [Saprospiraceae bacterium]
MTTVKLNINDKLNREIASFFKKSGINESLSRANKKLSYEDFLSDKMLIIAAIKAGIPFSLFELIKQVTPFTENDWAKILDISSKSLQRYKTTSQHHFKSIHSEKIIEMAEVTKVGLEVFGDMEKLKLWLNTPNFALGNSVPIELLNDSYGKELVIAELTRINYGILV